MGQSSLNKSLVLLTLLPNFVRCETLPFGHPVATVLVFTKLSNENVVRFSSECAELRLILLVT